MKTKYANRRILILSGLRESDTFRVLVDILRQLEYEVERAIHGHTTLPVEQLVAYHMEHCNPSEFTTYIRPWPRQVGENSRNGYDKLIPRTGIEIVVETNA